MSDFTVQVTDSDTPQRSASQDFRLDVRPWVPPPVVPVVMWQTAEEAQRTIDTGVMNGLELYEPERVDGSSLIVTDFPGWYGTPNTENRDVPRNLIDGMILGPKTLTAQEMTLQGNIDAVNRLTALEILDAIAARVVSAEPTTIIVSNLLGGGPGRYEQRQVRAISNLEQTWLNQTVFTYSINLRAADPRRYSTDLQRVRLWRVAGDTGRRYPKTYSWRYASETTGTSALINNRGNVPAPVLITYQSPLGQSRVMSSRANRSIFLDPMPNGRFFVNSETLSIWVTGGFSRARWIQPGSQSILVPPGEDRWSLYVAAATQGYVELEWRSAWL